MSLNRVKAVLLQEMYITLRSVEVINDIFLVSIISLLLFGFLSTYVTGAQNSTIAQNLLMGMLLWEIVRITQYSISVGSLWNIWARNLSNMFVSPMSSVEYLTAHTLSGIIKAILVFIVDSIIINYFFHFNIFQLGFINLFFFFLSLTMFAFATGIAILALIFRFGTRIQAFAWGFIPILQPLTATFFPVKILPIPFQLLAYTLPSTYVFEAARYSLTHQSETAWNLIAISFALNAIYSALAILFFKVMFRQSRNTGQFARNEG